MFKNFNQILQNHKLLSANKKMLLAVSGGVDSVVLFHLMRNIPKENRPQLSVAHVNHQLRPEADTEEQFVEQLAKQHHTPFYTKRWDAASHPKAGIEEAARKIRYSFFKQLMEKHQIDVLMTAHHQDDQVETILMKLTRGSTLSQLTGIPFTQSFAEGKLVRPLLGFSKEELYAYAHEQQYRYFEDASNNEMTQTRNRFRNRVIPLLKGENPQFNEHIERFAVELKDVLEIAQPVIVEMYERVVKEFDETMVLSIAAFQELSESRQRLVLKHLLDRIYQKAGYEYKTNYVELLQEWIFHGEVHTQLDLQNDILAKKEYNIVTFSKRKTKQKSIDRSSVRLEQPNQWYKLSKNERIGLFLLDETDEINNYMNDENTLLINESSLHLPLTVRHRQAGDRMRYEGLNGSKKVKDIFIDEKTPIEDRDMAWLVEDRSGEILWLISYRKRRLFTAQETDKLTYVLKYRKD